MPVDDDSVKGWINVEPTIALLFIALAEGEAKATEAEYMMPEPTWKPVRNAPDTQRLNLYTEMLRDRGITDEHEQERLRDCGPQRALRWADFLGVAETGTGGDAGGCLKVIRQAAGADAYKFQKAYNDGLSVSKALLRCGKGSAKLLNLHNGSSAGRAAVVSKTEVEQLTIGSAAKLQASLEAAAVKMVKEGGQGRASWPKLLAYYGAKVSAIPAGINRDTLAIIIFLRDKGVSAKEAATVASKYSLASKPNEPAAITSNEPTKKLTSWMKSRRRRAAAFAKLAAASALEDKLKLGAVAVVGVLAITGIVSAVKR